MLRFFTGAFFSAATLALAQTPTPAPRTATIYRAHDPGAIREYRADPAAVRSMVNRVVMAATGQNEIAKAWASLVSPNDVVGIKISAAGGDLFTTHHEVVNAIADGLAASGYPRNKIIVWDRSLGDIQGAGYRPEEDGYQLRSIPPRDGYDPKTAFNEPLLGKLIWGDLDYKPDSGKVPLNGDTQNESDQSHFCRIVSSAVTKIINVPVLSDSRTNGLTGCLYNATVPNVDNWRRFLQATSFGAASIPDIYRNPILGKKIVLNIMDGLLAQYAGGPEGEPNYSVHFATILASKDPVALDAWALRELEKLRAAARVPPIGNLGVHVEIAGEMGLGIANPARVTVKDVSR